jgi:hypothetical protein
MVEYDAFCEDHDLKLIDGCCPECRDRNGDMFPLDMQSTYLRPRATSSGPVAQMDRAVVS